MLIDLIDVNDPLRALRLCESISEDRFATAVSFVCTVNPAMMSAPLAIKSCCEGEITGQGTNMYSGPL